MKQVLFTIVFIITSINTYAQFYDTDDEIVIYENTSTYLSDDIYCTYDFLVFNFAGEKAKILNDTYDTQYNNGIIKTEYYKKDINSIIRDNQYFEKRIFENHNSRAILSFYRASSNITYKISYYNTGIELAWNSNITENYIFSINRQSLTVVSKYDHYIAPDREVTKTYKRISKEDFYNKISNWGTSSWRERTSFSNTMYE